MPKTKTDAHSRSEERQLLIDQVKQIARGLGETFAPFCEVVVHDLTDPSHSIVEIHNSLSQRAVGAPATELGIARISDPAYPQVIANYANSLNDGRQLKSTSIGIKGSDGEYVAALCLNLDLSLFQNLQAMLGRFASVDTSIVAAETIQTAGADTIRLKIDEFAAVRGTTPRSLSLDDRKTILQELKAGGFLEIRRAPEIIATHIGISRATVYANFK
ncbi:helix-turn-helix transcriptional regulator [Mesorhizobium sp. M0047]|uniref:helix-turn-helix transcriptional regulator n=1 Tax=Mesorhizobium sp. M0047 TaxID=2956859 RepID=UPI00333B1D99